MAIEEPPFVVTLREGAFEIRDYQAAIVAEVTVTGDQKPAADAVPQVAPAKLAAPAAEAQLGTAGATQRVRAIASQDVGIARTVSPLATPTKAAPEAERPAVAPAKQVEAQIAPPAPEVDPKAVAHKKRRRKAIVAALKARRSSHVR